MAENISLTNYTIGADAYATLGTVCARLGKKLLPIGGKRALAAAFPIMQAALSQSSDIALLNGFWYGGECSDAHIDVLAKHAQTTGADIIAGVGGGKAIDTAKAVAEKLSLPCITLPTVASTCAAVTPVIMMYDNKGHFTQAVSTKSPAHCFIDTDTISCAPTEYMRSGMGATLSKHYEVAFSSETEELTATASMAAALSDSCVSQLLKYGVQALADSAAVTDSDALDRVVLANIITSGYVSTLAGKEFSAALAHAMCIGLNLLPHVRKNYLQGDLVAYGLLVQLVVDGHADEAAKLYPFLRSWNTPVSLKDIHITLDWTVISPLLDEVVAVPSVAKKGITAEKIFEAMGTVETFAEAAPVAEVPVAVATAAPQAVATSPVEDVKPVVEKTKPVVKNVKPATEEVKSIVEEVKAVVDEVADKEPTQSAKADEISDEFDAFEKLDDFSIDK